MTSVDQIAEYIINKGVTKCPTVCLNKTTANTSAQERKLLRKHQEIQKKKADAFFTKTFYGKMFYFLIGFSSFPLLEYIT